MTDSFDQELRDAFAAENDEELADWKFTPAMQQEVLRRIETETAVDEVRPRRPSFTRTAVWVTVAAASLFMVVNLGQRGFLPMAGNSKPDVASSTANAPSSGSAPKPLATQQGTVTAAPMASAPQPPTENSAAGATMDNAGQAASMTATQAAKVPGAERSGDQPNQLVLALPPAPTAKAAAAAPRFLGVATAAALRLAYAPVTGQTLELNNASLAAYDAENHVMWQQPLSGLDANSQLAVAANGQSAVTAGKRLYLLGTDGRIGGAIDLPDPAAALAWSTDGRLAVLHGGQVTVYRSGQEAYKLAAEPGASLVFAPDGRLAVLSGGILHLYGVDGTTAVESIMEHSGRPIGFIAGGGLLVADSRSVWVVNPSDGHTLWQAQYDGAEGISKVATSPDATRIAVFTAPSSTPGLWLLDQNGKELQAETLPAIPDDAVFTGNTQLLFATGGTLQPHPIAP